MYQKITLIHGILVLLLLSNCATRKPKVESYAFRSLSESPQIFLPFHSGKVQPYLRLSFQNNTQSLSFLLDTGSHVSLLDESYFSVSDKRVRAEFLLPDKVSLEDRRVSVKDLYWGTQKVIEGAEFYSGRMLDDIGVDGILGINTISDKQVLLDYPNGIQIIRDENADVRTWFRGDFYALDRNFGFVVLKAWVKGVQIPDLVLDTGAGISFVDPKVIPGYQPQNDGTVQYLDASGAMQSRNSFYLQDLCVISELHCVAELKILEGGILSGRNPEIRGILGIDWAKHYQILLDFPGGRIGILEK